MAALALLAAWAIAAPANALTFTLQPGADVGKDAGVFYRYDIPATAATNYGEAERLYTQSNSSYWQAWGYYQFDLSALAASAGSITHAELTFHHFFVSAYDNYWSAGTESYVLESVGSPWNEAQITWNNKPEADGAFSATATINPNALNWEAYGLQHYAAVGTVTIDITGLVQKWIAGTTENNGVVYRMAAFKAHSAEDGAVFSSDSTLESYRPVLQISYQPVPEPATMVSVGIGLIGLAAAKRKAQRRSRPCA